MIEAAMNTVANALGYDCHAMFGAAAASHLDAPAGGFLGFSLDRCGRSGSIYRGLGVTLVVSPLRINPRVL